MPTPDQLLITFDKLGRPQPMTPTWITEQFEFHLGVKVPEQLLQSVLAERAAGARRGWRTG